jgi:hypothetical protein
VTICFAPRLMLLPTGRAFDERHLARERSFDVFEHRFADREIDRDIVTAKFFRKLIDQLRSLLVNTAPISSPPYALQRQPTGPSLRIRITRVSSALATSSPASHKDRPRRRPPAHVSRSARDPCARRESILVQAATACPTAIRYGTSVVKAHHAFIKSRNRKQPHRIVRRRVFKLARAPTALQELF